MTLIYSLKYALADYLTRRLSPAKPITSQSDSLNPSPCPHPHRYIFTSLLAFTFLTLKPPLLLLSDFLSLFKPASPAQSWLLSVATPLPILILLHPHPSSLTFAQRTRYSSYASSLSPWCATAELTTFRARRQREIAYERWYADWAAFYSPEHEDARLSFGRAVGVWVPLIVQMLVKYLLECAEDVDVLLARGEAVKCHRLALYCSHLLETRSSSSSTPIIDPCALSSLNLSAEDVAAFLKLVLMEVPAGVVGSADGYFAIVDAVACNSSKKDKRIAVTIATLGNPHSNLFIAILSLLHHFLSLPPSSSSSSSSFTTSSDLLQTYAPILLGAAIDPISALYRAQISAFALDFNRELDLQRFVEDHAASVFADVVGRWDAVVAAWEAVFSVDAGDVC
ncbi:hypothetical protein BZA70DRAFT_300482 [Myxozyma melibiosi]|uniref:Uncharacterized protein n=1 Tax=Myxozyma melibiosi TaxID=54550 RepID=A0ABR1FAY6_9ASCO